MLTKVSSPLHRETASAIEMECGREEIIKRLTKEIVEYRDE